ncbi:hypothetical protein [Emticicia sp. BO119]|uniref:hypothetical protein n=1 Tax=Emticicia sp. BO119 TaxID=2757768 RepID=UPI0015EFFB36|nr:hypothetical protein [Emticicia sp. BO119]MBA4850483.1 hypothetical protein [Emticicia sp. BO119]
MQTKTIIGLSMNTRMVAFAILRGTFLEHYQISLHKGVFNSEKNDRILKRLQKLTKTYAITDVALLLPYENHSTNHIKSLLESITTYFKKHNLPICTYYSEVLQVICEEGQPKTKKTIMESISRIYPQLQRLYHKEMQNKNKYYVRLFEAIGLAHIHSQSRNKADD